jgi:hypothetical protein
MAPVTDISWGCLEHPKLRSFGLPHRRMRDPAFRRSQEDGLRLPHVAPLNALVDELRDEKSRGWVPYIAPIHGGIDARMLSILRDPGPMTHAETGGSGFLCLENDDPTAERFATLLDEAGLTPSDMNPWNAYPWYINRPLTANEWEAGVEPLRRLIVLLPRLQVVMLNGGDAKDTWKRLVAHHQETTKKLLVLPTYHPGRQAFIGTPDVREARLRNLRDAFGTARRALA